MTSLVRLPGNLQYREGVGDPANSLDINDERVEKGLMSQSMYEDDSGDEPSYERDRVEDRVFFVEMKNLMKKMKDVSQSILRHLQAIAWTIMMKKMKEV